MASLQSQADAAVKAVSAVSTCSAATTVMLKELLGPREEAPEPRAAKTSRCRAPSRPTRSDATKKSSNGGSRGGREELSCKEKATCATQIVNAGLKALAEAARAIKPTVVDEMRKKSVTRHALGRSASDVNGRFRSRTLERVSTSPATAKRVVTSTDVTSTQLLSLVECVGLAFSVLRTLQAAGRVTLAELQLETGMSSFVGKLVALGLREQATRELRVIRRRLVPGEKSKLTTTTKTTHARIVAELLDFGTVDKLTGPAISLAVACQINFLRVLEAMKKAAVSEMAVEFLKPSCATSPSSLLLALSNDKSVDVGKTAKQWETLSQCLLALTPGVSSKEDAAGMESRLSISPGSALELQTTALECRMQSWRLTGCEGDLDRDVMGPLARCLDAYVRRSSKTPGVETTRNSYSVCCRAFRRIHDKAPEKVITSSRSPLFAILQSLTTLAREAGWAGDAVQWANKLRAALDQKTETAAKCCSMAAQLLSLQLSSGYIENDKLLREVVDGVQAPLKGEVGELDELLANVSAARKSAVALLKKGQHEHEEVLTSLILPCPRFCLRWLGKPPGPKCGTKEHLRYDVRRQLLAKHLPSMLDSALWMAKTRLEARKMTWAVTDALLTDCLGLLEHAASPDEAAWHVKISHCYYLQYKLLGEAEAADHAARLRALGRSIDCVKARPLGERDSASLFLKLERMAELCQSLGRTGHALSALQTMRASLVEDGVLTAVAEALARLPPQQAWELDHKTRALSRCLSTVARLEHVSTDWAVDRPQAEQAAALEHRLSVLLSRTQSSETLTLEHPTIDALLRLYTPTQFPLRRLRLLLTLLCTAMDKTKLRCEMQVMAQDALQTVNHPHCLGQDVRLEPFLTHWKAYYASLSAMADNYEHVEAVRDAVAAWTRLVDECGSDAEKFRNVVDDLTGLLVHLQSAGDLLKVLGHDDVLGLVRELACKIASMVDRDVMHAHTALASQCVALGRWRRADAVFEKAQHLASDSGPGVAGLHLGLAEYQLTMGNVARAEEHLALAKHAFTTATTTEPGSRTETKLLLAQASHVHSVVALEKGDSHHALVHARVTVRNVFQDWAKLEARFSTTTTATTATTTTIKDEPATEPASAWGPAFWRLAPTLMRGLLHLSAIYAHLGMHSETIYYATQAARVAQATGSSLYAAQCAAWTASVHARADDATSALDSAREARKHLTAPQEWSYGTVVLACQIGATYGELKNVEGGLELLDQAETAMDRLAVGNKDMDGVEEAMAKLSIVQEQPARRSVRKGKKPTVTTKTAVVEDVHVTRLRASMLVHKAVCLAARRDWTKAMTALQQAEALSRSAADSQLVKATCLLGLGMDQMARDSVFSVVQDSTLSIPAVAGDEPLEKASPGNSRREVACAGQLRQAQECLMEAHAVAIKNGDAGLVHGAASMLQSVALYLSAPCRPRAQISHAAFFPELARNLTWRRERKAISAEAGIASARTIEWPSSMAGTPDARRCSLRVATDAHQLQRECIDLLPEPWQVVCMSLSENQHDLCITKLRNPGGPFVLRLPLERASSRDADSHVFGFAQGRAALDDVVARANETCHSARNVKKDDGGAAKREWWAERERLDQSLGSLLQDVEHVWLGGFRGVFAPPPPVAATNRFSKALATVLDNHLPSRRRKGRVSSTGVTLDLRIAELFMGLGHLDDDDNIDEALTDLLYFVVDMLQFHGERNAYDEIDFDSMAVGTLDALFHAAAAATRRPKKQKQDSHTILILDGALHAFPWESLPCMQGLAVSRVPSLACLRRLLLECRGPCVGDENSPKGHYVSASSGTYMLNPSGDLASTQKTFAQPLATRLGATWKPIVGRAPTEDEFTTALADKDTLLYVGHGGGAQYVRARTVRRLAKCRAVALLMGCSSAALRAKGHGAFEAQGLARDYLLAGCPAVVGTLWDVTDRDVDRFTARLLEGWGMVPRDAFEGTGADEKSGPTREAADQGGNIMSLVQAVAAARQACRFRNVTAAAPVVYGIPVYVET